MGPTLARSSERKGLTFTGWLEGWIRFRSFVWWVKENLWVSWEFAKIEMDLDEALCLAGYSFSMLRHGLLLLRTKNDDYCDHAGGDWMDGVAELATQEKFPCRRCHRKHTFRSRREWKWKEWKMLHKTPFNWFPFVLCGSEMGEIIKY